MDIDLNSNMGTARFLQLQEANNICKAAYKALMVTAFEANTWVVETPAVGSIEEFLSMFQRSPPSGMRVEFSIERASVPIAPEHLISILMDANQWPSLFPHIVRQGSSHVPGGVLQYLRYADEDIGLITTIHVELQYPSPFVPTREFCFLRCQRQITPDAWVIYDVSEDYFRHTPSFAFELKDRRRPSGIIIRRCPETFGSEVIWIENMEVQEWLAQGNIFSTVVNSNLAFCARRWVNALLQRLKRSNSRFTNPQMQAEARAYMLQLVDCMEMVYLECISEAPSGSKWVILSDQGMRILRDKTIYHSDAPGFNSYVALSSFHVPANPLCVFDFLVKRNMELQWPYLDLEESEGVIRLATDDDSNCITLHKKVVPENESMKCYEYILQEASRDEFCSLVISSQMTQSDLDAPFPSAIKPSGFTIMPDGYGGLQSDASLVTIAIQKDLDVPETSQAIEVMSHLTNTILEEIKNAVLSSEKPTQPQEPMNLGNKG